MLNIIENPTLDKAIKQAIDKELYETHTCIPGIVDSVDHATKKVSVRLSLKRKYLDEKEAREMPIIQDIPLCTMQTANTIISLPVAKGDDCLVFFTERSLDIWKTNSESSLDLRIIDPKDPRKHHISDALCLPIAKPFGTGITGDSGKIKIAYTENNKLTLDINGNLKYVNSDGSIWEIDRNSMKFTNSDGSNFKIENGELRYTNATGAVFTVENSAMRYTNTSGADLSIDSAGKFEFSNGENDALSAISSFMSQAISAFTQMNPIVFPPPSSGIQSQITAMGSAQTELNGVKQ